MIDIDEPSAAQHSSRTCPDDGALVDLLAGRCGAVERRALHAHVDDCARCRELLAHLARFTASTPMPVVEDAATVASGRDPNATWRTIGRGTRIAHFEILELIGEGGMGTVHAALDTKLGRTVAIKLVHAAELDPHDAEPSLRLLREAQAMAAVAHPNVVTVYEVGTFGNEVFIAMERVDGDTLARWLSVTRRRWVDVVRVFVAAGRGLAAAHAAGLVHRDFKPHNVLVAGDGRVCVTDFGLVQAGGELPSSSATLSDADAHTLSEHGQLMGTPRYMAPEQLLGVPVDARTDQFGFCVALFEALWLRHPFGDGPRERIDAVLLGYAPVRVPSGGVPPRIRRAIARGLSSAREQRFATMTELLGELGGALQRRRQLAIAAVVAVIVAAAVLLGFVVAGPAPGVCETTDALEFGAAWRAPDQRAAVARTVQAGRLGVDGWPRVEMRLDAYAEQGERLRAELCERIDARSGPARVLDGRTLECLAMHDQVLGAVVELLGSDELGTGDPLDVIDALAPLSACEHIGAQASVPVPPRAELEASVLALRRRIAAAGALAWAGRPEPATAELQAILGEAEALGYPPLLVHVHRALGRAMQSTDVPAAIEELRIAHALALRVGADVDTVETLLALATMLADRGEEAERAAWMIDELEAWRDRLGLPPSPELVSLQGTIARARGDLDAAIAFGEQALELAATSSPSLRTGLHANLGAMYAEHHQLARAREHAELALTLSEDAYGPDHRRTLRCRANLVGIAFRLGDIEQAEADGRALVERFAATGSAELPETAVTLTLLGMIARNRGEYDAASDDDQRALDIRTRVFGERHRLVAESLEKLALDELGAERPAEALVQLRRVVALRRELHPETHPALALARIELGRALLAVGEPIDADRESQAALVQLEASFARDDVRLYGPFLYAGMAALGVDDFERARIDLDRAAELGEQAGLEPLDRAELELARARAMARGDRSLPAARALASTARERLHGIDAAERELQQQIDAWLAGD